MSFMLWLGIVQKLNLIPTLKNSIKIDSIAGKDLICYMNEL